MRTNTTFNDQPLSVTWRSQRQKHHPRRQALLHQSFFGKLPREQLGKLNQCVLEVAAVHQQQSVALAADAWKSDSWRFGLVPTSSCDLNGGFFLLERVVLNEAESEHV